MFRPVGSLIKDIPARTKSYPTIAALQVRQLAKDVISRECRDLPPEVVEAIQPTSFKAGILTIKTDSALVSSELKMRAGGLVENINLGLGKKLANLTLLTNSPDTQFASIRINKDGRVIYLASRYFNRFTQGDSHKLKSPKEAVREIRNGLGKVVHTALLSEFGKSLGLASVHEIDIGFATFNSLKLTYFLPDDTNEQVQPIYIAEGEFQKGTEKGRVIIYLPAVKNLLQPKP